MVGVTAEQCNFYSDGEPVFAEMTPEQLDLDHDFIIDVQGV